jgi:GT2 family glycosyltransferase
MKTGVILVNWNNPADTLACLASLYAGTVPPDHVVVWDNGSHGDDAARIATAFPAVDLVRHPDNAGFATANNLAAQRLLATGVDTIWILNNDTVVEPDCLRALTDHLVTHPDCGAVTGRILYADRPDLIWYAGGDFRGPVHDAVHRGEGQPDAARHDLPGPITFMTGCCMLIRADLIARHGLFNDAYLAYFEDADWSLRMAAAGVRLDYTPAARLIHKGSASIRINEPGRGFLSPRQHYLQTRNRLWMLREHLRSPARRTLALTLFTGRALRYAAMNLALLRTNKVTAILRGLREGLFTPPPPCPSSTKP